MHISPADLTIPGVSNNSAFSEWIDNHNIRFSTGLSIGQSELGGIGLYFEKSREYDDDLEILRIPLSSKIDYMSLLELLESLKERDELYDEVILESQLIVEVLTAMEPSTETHILHSYIVAFYILKQIRAGQDLRYFLESPLIGYDQYLDILSGTYTLGNITGEDPFFSKLSETTQKTQRIYENLIEQLDETYELQLEKMLPFEMFLQLQQAIQSRTLEIPYKDEDPELNLQKLSLEESESDFYINVTLVPILDFANHTQHNNAYFDVDRETSDIILKLKHESLKGKKIGEKFELTISYSPVESVQHFVTTYGFIPSIVDKSDYQLFELKLPIEDMVPNGRLISKWLGVVPQIQIINGHNQTFINIFNNSLPLVFMDDLSYNPQWRDTLETHFKLFNELTQDYDIDIDEVEEVVRLQEEGPYETITGVGPIGLKYKEKVLENIDEVTSLVGDGSDNTIPFDDLVERCIQKVVHYCQELIARPVTPDQSVSSQYLQYQRQIAQNLVTSYKDDYTQLLLPETLAQTEWEVTFRSPPKQMDIT